MLQEYKLYGGKTTIKFDDQRHIFYDPKGESLTSVTGATGVVDKSGALMGWTAKTMGLYLLEEAKKGNDKITEDLVNQAKKEYRRLKQEAADLGTEIHSWVSEWIKGKKPSMPENEKVVNGITAFLKFQKEHQIKWLETERIIYSKKHAYAGILDAIGEMEGKLTLVDFKSSNAIYDEMRFQVAGYQIAYEEEMKKDIEKRVIIRFGKEDGQFEVFDLGKDGKDKQVFLACLKIKKRLDELK
jgi:CRISPR/Cas system-associated exonuclease Cas4 (RecB family)